MSMTKNKYKRIFIIDGYALLYRSHFALIRNPLLTSYGLDTSALFGFVNQMLKLIRKENPDYLVCAFDSKGKNFRHEMYDAYKANRPEMPLELQKQLPHLWEILDALKIPTIKKKGFEADDIIGTLATKAQKDDLVSYIVSGDKDFMQLINDKIFLYAPGTRKSPKPIIYDASKVEERWGVPPKKFIDLLGLMGDSSDNVPGVAGVGEKTAVKLIKEYGSLEGALANVDKIKNKRVKNGLKEGVENALLSKKLVKILTNIDLSVNVLDCQKSNIDLDACKKKFSELEFHNILKQVSNLGKSDDLDNDSKYKKDYKTILNKDDLDQMIDQLNQANLISFDLETTSIIPMEAEIVGLSFSIKDHQGYYIPIKYPEKIGNNFGDNDQKVVLDKLKTIFEDKSKSKTGQNIKYDSLILRKNGINIKGVDFDTMIAAHLINPIAKSVSLEALSIEYLNYEMIPIRDLIGKGKNETTMDKVSIEKVAFYAMEDSDVVFQLTGILKNKLKQHRLFDYFSRIEIPLLSVLIEMEYVGTFVDSKLLKKMSDDIGEKLKSITSSIFFIARKEFNINSTQQLAKILFDDIGLPQIKSRSTAENILKKLSKYHELPQFILEYRKYFKLKNTYLDTLQNLVSKGSGRIHTTFNQTIAATGRLSSTNPNFQNIPIRREEGKEIRRAFCPEEKGWRIFSFDYSQIELRIMAHYSKDPNLINAFKNNKDIHSETASSIFNIPVDSVLPDMRRTAKVVNFGIMYGAGPFRLSQELGVTMDEASRIIGTYFTQYPGIKSYIIDTIENAKKNKYVETILGRKRPVWDADSDNAIRKKAAERMAINMPIQGSAAEMIKVAMIAIYDEILRLSMKSKMILQIHDELLFEVPIEEEEKLVSIVVNKMENAMKLSVPIVVDYGAGHSWIEAH